MVRYQLFCWYSHSYPCKKKARKSPESQEKPGDPGFLGFSWFSWKAWVGCHSRKSLESQEFTLGFHGKPGNWSCCQEQEKPRKPKTTENFPVFQGKAGVTDCSVAKNSQESQEWHLLKFKFPAFKGEAQNTLNHTRSVVTSAYVYETLH